MSKGGEFEKEIAKQLSLWWTQDHDVPRDDIFYRTHGSGSRHTSRMKQSKSTANAAGDLMFIDEIGKSFLDYFIVEMKRGYTSVGRINTKDIENIVDQVLKSHKQVSKELRKYIAKKLKKGGDRIDVLDYIDSDKEDVLIKWWEKLEKERNECGRKFSILIFKRDSKQTCMMINFGLWDKMVDCVLNVNTEHIKTLTIDEPQLVIFRFEEFLNNVHPRFIGYLEDDDE